MTRRRTPGDFSDEIDAHLALEADRLAADGLGADEARAAARRAFGNVTLTRERYYEQSRWIWLEQFVQDLRYAWRGLLHSRAFLATTVLTLAVGLGLITVAFTVVNAYVLRPYAVREPSNLRQLVWQSPASGSGSFRWRDFQALRGRSDVFSAVIGESTRLVSSNGQPLAVALVSDNYFDVLGPRFALGRGLAGIDDGVQAAVLSYGGWTRLFQRDPAVLGRSLDVNGRAFVVVGVAAPGFAGLADMPRDAFVPLTTYAAVAQPELTGTSQRAAIQITGRLRDDVTVAQGEAALGDFVAALAPGDTQDVRAELRRQDSPQPLTAESAALLAPVFAAFALVLLTACANVSNVMLARAVARHREIAVRLSLGAGRARVVRQLLTEGLVIAMLSGALALAFASWALRAGVALFFRTLPPSVAAFLRIEPIGLDHRVFLFAFAVAALATLMFALVPAIQASQLPLTDALRGQGGHARRGSRLRNALVIAQVTVSLVLVVVALTLARNGLALAANDLGYDPRGVVSVNVREEQTQLVRGLAEVLAADPHIAEVAATGGNPLFIRSRTISAAAGASAAVPARFTFVSPEYFSILRIPLVQGRGFRGDEARAGARVAIVSAATAAAFWPGEDPVGRTIRLEGIRGKSSEGLLGYPEVTVVGVVPDVVSGFVADGKDPWHVYLPTTAAGPHASALLIRGRTAGDLRSDRLQPMLARAAADPQTFEALPLDEMRDLQNYPLLAASVVGTALGFIALALSVSGLYGVLAYMLSQRTREIGIRMALGASAGAVVRLVLRQSGRLAGVGIGIGFTIALAAMLALRSVVRLDAVTVVDPLSFAAGASLVAAATAMAAWFPARRAARVDPARTLRAD
jgi:predicted permease